MTTTEAKNFLAQFQKAIAEGTWMRLDEELLDKIIEAMETLFPE